jgi:single-strand DNA-binding protein
MANLNKVLLMGRLTRDPELRYTPNGAAVTDLPLAINRTYSTKDGDRREETLFVDVTVWNRQAETCCQYLKKGRAVHVEGFLKTETWDDKTTGDKRSKTKVEAERVQFLDSRRDEAGGGGTDDFAPPTREAQPRRAPASPADARGASNGPGRSPGGMPGGASSRRPADTDADDEDNPF